jgi:hypothetical protein
MRYANNSFSTPFITTIGIDFKMKDVNIDGKKIRLQVREDGNVKSPNYILDMGHSWARKISNNYDFLFPWLTRHLTRV